MKTECAGFLHWVCGGGGVETGEVGSGTVELILTHTGVHVSYWETALFSLRTVCMLADILWCQRFFLLHLSCLRGPQRPNHGGSTSQGTMSL